MLRATKLFSAFLFLALVFAGANQIQADGPGSQIMTYEMGPFVVYGLGFNESEAADDAYGEAYDLMASIAASLPDGHWIHDFVVEDEGLVTPTSYMLEFHIVVAYQVPGP